MEDFQVGQYVNVPCEIQPEAFPPECLVTVKTEDGILSGFVRTEYLPKTEGTTGMMRAKIVKIDEGAITVRMPGSFFTTAAGMTSVSKKWAS